MAPSSTNLGREKFGRENFRTALAPHRLLVGTRGAANRGALASFAVCLWNLLLPRFVVGTFVFQGGAAKISEAGIFATHRRYAAFGSSH